MSELHDIEIIHDEKETGLKISRLKVNGGWIYAFSYPMGLKIQFVEEKDNEND